MAHDIVLAVARVDDGFVYLHLLTGELCTLHPAYQLFGLPGEHAPADYFYAATAASLSVYVVFVLHYKTQRY